MASKITKVFLEEAIKEPIVDFTVSAGSKAGDNVAGQLLAVKVTTKSGKVRNLVYKFLSDDPVQRDWATKEGIFNTEISVYCHLMPELSKFIEKHSGIPYESFVPEFCSGLHDGENDYLLLEDIRPRGYQMQDKFSGLNLQEASLIMKKIAEFHASTYFFLKQEGERRFEEDINLQCFVSNQFSKDTPENRAFGNLMFGECVRLGLDLLKKHDKELGEKIATVVQPEQAYGHMRQMSINTDTKHFPCIIHGDFWLNNIMIKYENDDRTKPVDLKFIDFQMTRRDNIFSELNYFLCCSTTPKFRKEHYENVLRVYYDSFKNFLEDRLKTKLPIGFTRGYFLNSMYEMILPGFIYMSFAIPMQLADPPNIQTMMGEAAATLGLDLSSLSPPNGDGGENKENEGPPPDFPPEIGIKLRNAMLFLQLEKSPRGVKRYLQMAQELIDLKLV